MSRDEVFRRGPLHSWLRSHWYPIVATILAIFFLTAWLFDFLDGPFKPDRVGNLGDWVSGIGTVGAVAFSLWLYLKQKHQERWDAWMAENYPDTGQLESLIDGSPRENKESLRRIPVICKITDIEENFYRFDIQVFNYSDLPILEIKAVLTQRMNLTKAQTEDEAAPKNYLLGSADLLLPQQCESFQNNYPQDAFDPDQLNEGGAVIVSWRVGKLRFSHRYRIANGNEHRRNQEDPSLGSL